MVSIVEETKEKFGSRAAFINSIMFAKMSIGNGIKTKNEEFIQFGKWCLDECLCMINNDEVNVNTNVHQIIDLLIDNANLDGNLDWWDEWELKLTVF